ncbi:MAG: hypothetical protein ACSW8E_01585 [Clostridia bacterium]
MNFGKVKAVFFILVFFLLLALVVNAALGLDAKKQPAEEPTEEPAQTELVPAPAQETPVPIPTWAPAPTPPPANQPAQPQNNTPAQPQNNTPAAAPTPAPTPAPRPAGQNLGSDSFRSQTGAGIELICDWSAVSIADNKAEVTLTVSIESSTIYLNEWTDCIGLRVGDQTGTLTQPALSYEGGKTTHSIGAKTFTVSLAGGSSFPVAVEWHYNGTYSGVQIDVVECGGTINLG